MIILDSKNIEFNSFKDYFVVYLEGEFHDITPHEFRFITFVPHNILYEKEVSINYNEYYFQATLVETQTITTRFLPFLKNKEEKHHNITINSYNNSSTYAFLLPFYDSEHYGTFRFELVISKEEFKRIKFKQLLEKL